MLVVDYFVGAAAAIAAVDITILTRFPPFERSIQTLTEAMNCLGTSKPTLK